MYSAPSADDMATVKKRATRAIQLSSITTVWWNCDENGLCDWLGSRAGISAHRGNLADGFNVVEFTGGLSTATEVLYVVVDRRTGPSP